MITAIVELPADKDGRDTVSVLKSAQRVLTAFGQMEPDPARRTYSEGDLYFMQDDDTGALAVHYKNKLVLSSSPAVGFIMIDLNDGGSTGWLEQMREIERCIP